MKISKKKLVLFLKALNDERYTDEDSYINVKMQLVALPTDSATIMADVNKVKSFKQGLLPTIVLNLDTYMLYCLMNSKDIKSAGNMFRDNLVAILGKEDSELITNVTRVMVKGFDYPSVGELDVVTTIALLNTNFKVACILHSLPTLLLERMQ